MAHKSHQIWDILGPFIYTLAPLESTASSAKGLRVAVGALFPGSGAA